MKRYHKIACGGTFDLLHEGHKYFLQKIFDQSEKVIIGLTSDKYILENKPNRGIASFEERKKNLELFLEEIGAGERVRILAIDDMYGPLLDPKFQVDVLAVTKHSLQNAQKINEKREELSLTPLEIVEIELKKDKSGEVISSTNIRENLLLPSTLRKKLQEAWGEIYQDIPEDIDKDKLITVGDVTTQRFLNLRILPILAIIDFKVEREQIPEYNLEGYRKIFVKNPPGAITSELFEIVNNAFKDKDKKAIIIDGEEDLSVLPALLYAPLGYEIYYGQPNVGLVRMKVVEKMKERAQQLISQFQPSM